LALLVPGFLNEPLHARASIRGFEKCTETTVISRLLQWKWSQYWRKGGFSIWGCLESYDSPSETHFLDWRQRHRREISQLLPKRQLCQACRASHRKRKRYMQGRIEGGKVGTISGRRMTAGRQIVPTMSQVLSSIQYIYFRKTSVSNMGEPILLLAPGAI